MKHGIKLEVHRILGNTDIRLLWTEDASLGDASRIRLLNNVLQSKINFKADNDASDEETF